MGHLPNQLLHRFWFKFEEQDLVPGTLAKVLWLGCGITAYSLEDALSIVSRCIWDGGPVPQPKSVVEDIDVSTLDQGHVVPNMAEPASRGMWFPADLDWRRGRR